MFHSYGIVTGEKIIFFFLLLLKFVRILFYVFFLLLFLFFFGLFFFYQHTIIKALYIRTAHAHAYCWCHIYLVSSYSAYENTRFFFMLFLFFLALFLRLSLAHRTLIRRICFCFFFSQLFRWFLIFLLFFLLLLIRSFCTTDGNVRLWCFLFLIQIQKNMVKKSVFFFAYVIMWWNEWIQKHRNTLLICLSFTRFCSVWSFARCEQQITKNLMQWQPKSYWYW